MSASDAGTTYTYDSNGNLTSKTEGTDTWGYEWNALDQLTRVTKNSVEQARLTYDPLGRRVEKIAGGVTTTYTQDGDNILREVRGTLTLKYVHGLSVDEPLATDDGTANTYFHADALGSIAVLTNAAGVPVATRQYDAWGNLQSGIDQPGSSFTGREWDPETGLYYYRARYYSPQSSRFISEDPLGLRGGPNLFVYVRDDPTSRIDPSGLQSARPPTGPPPSGVYECQRPMYGGNPVNNVPHGLLWSTMCNQSYSFSPGPPPTGGHIDPNDDPALNHQGIARYPYQCTLITPNACFQDCVCKVIQRDMANPPRYGPNNMCWDAIRQVQVECRLLCRMAVQ